MVLKNKLSCDFIEKLLKQNYLTRQVQKLKEHHDESASHSIRVGQLAVDIGYENEFSDSDLTLLGLSGIIHDIGKCDIKDKILSKKSSLTKNERNDLQQHPRLGFKKIENTVMREVQKIIVGHHEHKISPYPRKGIERRGGRHENDRRENNEKIKLLTEIISAADIFDALVNNRSYKKPFKRDEVQKIIRDQFTGDKKLIDQVISRF